MNTTRFVISRPSRLSRVVVEDTAAPKYEDAVLYSFKSVKAAKAFVAMLLAEKAAA